MLSIYKQLRNSCFPHMEAFQRDLLLVDRKLIAAHPGTPFLHWTRKHGTHITFLIPANEYPAKGKDIPFIFGRATRENLLQQFVDCAVSWWSRPGAVGPIECTHWFDGVKLREITTERAAEVARDYGRKIRAEWDKDKHPVPAEAWTPWG